MGPWTSQGCPSLGIIPLHGNSSMGSVPWDLQPETLGNLPYLCVMAGGHPSPSPSQKVFLPIFASPAGLLSGSAWRLVSPFSLFVQDCISRGEAAPPQSFQPAHPPLCVASHVFWVKREKGGENPTVTGMCLFVNNGGGGLC